MPLGTGLRLRVAKAGPGLVLLGRTLAEAKHLPISKVSWPQHMLAKKLLGTRTLLGAPGRNKEATRGPLGLSF